jgi:hypothetical protein
VVIHHPQLPHKEIMVEKVVNLHLEDIMPLVVAVEQEL